MNIDALFYTLILWYLLLGALALFAALFLFGCLRRLLGPRR